MLGRDSLRRSNEVGIYGGTMFITIIPQVAQDGSPNEQQGSDTDRNVSIVLLLRK
jgi:hypothetical protein